MNQDIKKQWVDALRSGEFSQGTGYLRNVTDNLYCCLGVLAEQAVKAGVPIEVVYETHPDSTVIACYDGSDDFLPESVQDWAGLDRPSPTVRIDSPRGLVFEPLAELNDGNYTFAEIADLIEEQL